MAKYVPPKNMWPAKTRPIIIADRIWELAGLVFIITLVAYNGPDPYLSLGQTGSHVLPDIGGDTYPSGPTWYGVVWQRDVSPLESDIFFALVNPLRASRLRRPGIMTLPPKTVELPGERDEPIEDVLERLSPYLKPLDASDDAVG